MTLIAASALALAACSGPSEPGASGSASGGPGARTDGPDPSILPAAADAAVTTRVAEDVVPPTNRWYSALAFGDTGLPVFPAPLSFQAVDGGFAAGLTRPVASENAIVAPAVTDVTLTFAGASGYGEVTEATPVGTTLTLGPVDVVLAQGVPVIGFTVEGGTEATLSVAFADAGDGVATATVGETTYGLAIDGGSVDGTSLSLDPGGTAQLFAVPDGGDALAFAAALGPLARGADASFSLGEAATTTVAYADVPTVVAVPASRAEGLECTLGSYATIHGTYSVCEAAEVSWAVPLVEPSASLDLSGITGPERKAVTEALTADADAALELPADTYFGSKALYRLANLVQVADALGSHEVADRLQRSLAEQLDLWGEAAGCASRAERCFTYDATLRGVVGLATAFGSEQFNDHHFHYGYLLYAAAVAGARDPELAARIAPVMDLVAEDIAAPGTSESFPVRRVFDPVAGHSWASGTSPFADGNNQESSSEAVLAWNAVALWAEVTDDADLGGSARWMLSAESEAARRLQLAPDLSAFPEFAHGVVAIEWGAKRDYATWFSAEPAAMLGIQVIPGQPTSMATLAEVPAERIVSTVDEAWGQASLPAMFADYLLMYRALAGDEERAAAWTTAVDLPDDAIDDGDSRTWLLAWIAAAG
ncbi:glycosyl hydrolase [Demequina gelatinilytica]|uniref:glycosyl hydrolase n=1 Tax=Demequina gelatinilytica TaxID=1638980 RepID=UPI0012E0B2B9|nr:glycosyl hydrolase [Demequina gelatinilytica]